MVERVFVAAVLLRFAWLRLLADGRVERFFFGPAIELLPPRRVSVPRRPELVAYDPLSTPLRVLLFPRPDGDGTSPFM